MQGQVATWAFSKEGVFRMMPDADSKQRLNAMLETKEFTYISLQ